MNDANDSNGNFDESPLRDFLRLNRIILSDPMILEMLQSPKLRCSPTNSSDEEDDEQDPNYFYYSEIIAIQR